ncbi:hypothetical protein BMS3Bbin05_01149 [bacterium BMS3Bbin05]|nr:hypothetical protein BMS3Bbin05_01149 [bacterium BMS3Bbin05]
MNYLWNIWDVASWVLMPLTFLATIMLSLKGLVKVPGHRIIRLLLFPVSLVHAARF